MMRSKASLFGLLAFGVAIHLLFLSRYGPAVLGRVVCRRILFLPLLWCAFVAAVAYFRTRRRPLLLLDYSCFRPGSDRRCSLEICDYLILRSRRYTDKSIEFLRTIFIKSGLGEETYAPPFVFQTDGDAKLQYAVQEAEEGMFGATASLLAKTSIDPSRITHLIVACSSFSPAPSLATMIVNHFNLDESVKSYNLSGMGCSAGTVAFDLANRLLGHRIGYILVVVTESTSLNWYFGDNRHMLVSNCIFRVGAAAALLTNDTSVRHRAKMELVRTLRTHHGADDTAYYCASQKEDEDGNVGVELTKDLIRVAGVGLKSHISTLAPHVLPLSEMVRYACNVTRSYLSGDRKAMAAHVPDFTTAFEHVCIHAGGKAVIDAVGRLMKFDSGVVEPARMCLHRFGNTSSSLVLYELAYFEAKGRIKEGDMVWMLGFGTGFKASSVVWRALRDSWMDPDNPWSDCIHRYPI